LVVQKLIELPSLQVQTFELEFQSRAGLAVLLLDTEFALFVIALLTFLVERV